MAFYCLLARWQAMVVLAMLLTGCAPQGLYYWGDYEGSLYDRYVQNDGQHTEAYLRNTFTEAETQHRKVPPGVYADYGFLLYTRGDKAGAIAYFEKERALYPESAALMNKLIERIRQKDKTTDAAGNAAVPAATGGVQ